MGRKKQFKEPRVPTTVLLPVGVLEALDGKTGGGVSRNKVIADIVEAGVSDSSSDINTADVLRARLEEEYCLLHKIAITRETGMISLDPHRPLPGDEAVIHERTLNLIKTVYLG